MNNERAASLIFLCAGIYGLIFSIPMPMGRWYEPGPGVFPLSLSILLCLSGFLWFALGKKKGDEEGPKDWHGVIRKLASPGKIVGLTAVFIISLDFLGYMVASCLYLFLLFLWVSRYRSWTSMGLAIVFGGGSWYFFGELLAIHLPKGLWFP
jgi:hypothetical protein